MNNASKNLLIALSLSLAACGGPSKAKTPVTPEPDPSAVVATPEPAKPSLPNVPSTPAEAPAGLTATVTARNPNAQLTQIGTFVDAVFPGMAAFLTPQTLMQQIEAILGVVGLRGLDMNQPLYVLMLDSQAAILVGTVASEAELQSSVEGTRVELMTHDGFAAIGSFDALHSAGPYALSNLVKAQVPELPTVELHLGKIMKGPQAAMVRNQVVQALREEGGEDAGEVLLKIMSSIETLSLSIDATPEAATLRLAAAGLSGELQTLAANQRPAAYSMFERVGTGPWSMALGGRLDLTSYLPHLVKLGEVSANPIMTQVAAQLGSLNGEMAVGVTLEPKPVIIGGMEVTDGKGLGQLVDVLLRFGDKSFERDGLKAKLRMNAIRTRAGSLHEIRATSTTPETKAYFGKTMSAFFGTVADTLLFVMGPDSKAQARTLTARSGALPGTGAKLTQALATSKSLNESFIMAFDVMGLQSKKAPTDADPFIIGAGFTGESITGRVVLPASVMREAAQGAF